MAHKTLIGGTAYNIIGGRSMVNGTGYSIASGRTLINGTGYNINFESGAVAMLYTTGDFVFQRSTDVESGKTLIASYTGFEKTGFEFFNKQPWASQLSNIKNVYCIEEIAPINMNYWFAESRNLKQINFTNINISHVESIAGTFSACSNLTGSPIYWPNVVDMSSAYSGCSNLTGSPICGDKVIKMGDAYHNCSNLTGSPVCGNNVTSMYQTYAWCKNLTGSPVCGNKVTNMHGTYRDCYNLTGPAVCGESVTRLDYAYQNCFNLSGNAYFYSPYLIDVDECFGHRNIKTPTPLNIYIPSNSTTKTTIVDSYADIVGSFSYWNNMGTYYYLSGYNIYVYPVANVAAARAANGD